MMTATDEPGTAGERYAAAPADPGRPRRRGPWLWLAALTALVVAVPLGLEVAGVQLERSSDTSETLPPHALRAVEIDATSAAVTVRSAASGQARLRKDLHWTLARPQIRTSWDGDTLRLKAICEDGAFNRFGLCDAEVTLSVPPGVSVRGRVASGTLAVRGLSGGVDVVGNSGTLELSDLSGPVRARVGSGSVNGERLRSGDVSATAGSGSIDLGFTSAPQRVVARTGSGSIALAVPAGSRYALSGRSGSGSWEIADGIVDSSSANSLDLTTGSGSVDVHY
ncbi:hypothetical protein AB0J52_15340 [Spirillospora sp. NPDC049652]